MKMTYHLKPRRQNNYRKTIFVTVVFVIIIIIQIFFPRFLIGIISMFGLPIMKTEVSISDSLSGITNITNSKKEILEENEKLRLNIDALKYSINRADLLELENLQLKELLGRSQKDKKIVLATVLARPPQTAYDSLIVDVGSEHGVKVGDRVRVQGSITLGTVSEVYENMSKVVLYSSSGNIIDVLIGTTTRANAEALGAGNFKVKLPKEEIVTEGDIIAIPSINGEFFGRVSSIEIIEGDAFKYIRFNNPVNLSSLRFVEIEKQEVGSYNE